MKRITNTDKLKDLAIEAFKDHKIICLEEGRWRIAKKNQYGQIESMYLTEIISLFGGRLFAGGDINDCIFAYYTDTKNHIDKLKWIGECEDVGYIHQKAKVGMTDSGKLTSQGKGPSARVIYAWAAVNKLCQLLDEINILMKSDDQDAVKKGIDNLCFCVEKAFLLDHLKVIQGKY